MKKRAYFDTYDGDGWPDASWLESFFFTKSGRDRLCGNLKGGNDSWGFSIANLYGQDDFRKRDWTNVDLSLTANPTYGVMLQYSKWDGELQCRLSYSSKGSLGRLKSFVRNLHGDGLSVGLFIPFEQAWKAVQEFILTDGQLPTSIEWISDHDLPPNSFLLPHEQMLLLGEQFSGVTFDEQREINRIGAESGCHSCGDRSPGTLSGNFIPDAQPPTLVNWSGKVQRIYPQCLFCKMAQGAAIRDLVATNDVAPGPGVFGAGGIAFVADGLSGGGSIRVARGRNIWAADDCVAFGLMALMDGATEVMFKRFGADDYKSEPQLDVVIDTPSNSVGIFTIDRKIAGFRFSCEKRTRVRIWTDRASEPKRVDIVLN